MPSRCTIIDGSSEPGDLGVVLVAIAAAAGVATAARRLERLPGRGAGNPTDHRDPRAHARRAEVSRCCITDGFITTVTSAPYKFMSQGDRAGLPFALYVSIAAITIVTLIERRTALGMLTEAVGINPEAARLAGVGRAASSGAYIASGLLAGFAGVLSSSNTMAADANALGANIELYAILAVVLGGTSLMGGKFSIAGTVIGVFSLQTLRATITFLGRAEDVARCSWRSSS